MSPEQLWAERYAARHAEERAREESRRETAFLDLPAVVAGEPLRLMTPLDLLALHGAESPFVCGGREPESADIAVFFWWLHTANDHRDTWSTRRTRRALVRRLAPLAYAEVARAALNYVDEMFQDAPATAGTAEGSRPLGTCFLAPLVVHLALKTGWSQHEILSTPLPRLFQYRKAIRAQEEGKDFVDSSPSDRITSEFLTELNTRINAPSAPETPAPAA